MKPPVEQDVIDQLAVLYYHFKKDIDVTWYQDLAYQHNTTYKQIKALLPRAQHHAATKRGVGKLIEWCASSLGEAVPIMRGIVPVEDYTIFYEFWCDCYIL